ncbi:hypothetical protein EL17_20145 [Anditalea andensis]|uniref:CRISPR type III-associated protein domain-containing protein n=2 Tax=Anditalea andensis TaxID=1048983 RepID=A0A074L0Y7_9BACT|nr:hypothetical protein EL17_20145 [Anditalea andensis]
MINTDTPNLGWLFYKEYYQGLTKDLIDNNNEKGQEGFFKEKNDKILKAQFRSYHNTLVIVEDNNTNEIKTIEMKTTYPGLIMGTGVTHETGLKGEMKLGLSFDYTTGLPYIPGSSVKGILRSVFPGSFTKADEEFKEARIAYIRDHLDNQELNVEELEAELFEGKGSESIYDRDVFMDAHITDVPGNGIFLGSDFLTPHGENPLKNPNPIQFLKILPEVTFTFYFKFKGGVITEVQKRELFEKILKDIGVGAKTNVGYGQLVSSNK